MKVCSRCKAKKPPSEFHRHCGTHDGLQTVCKPCAAEYKRHYAQRKRELDLMHKYGITVDQYNDILEHQGGVCAICGSSEPSGRGSFFAVDHCHETGRVRGLLCGKCNPGLGYFDDNPDLFLKAIRYLRSSELALALST